MKHLVIGLGEVGSALREVLGCGGHDPTKEQSATGHYDCLHICFPHGPYQETLFAEEVRKYRDLFQAKIVVIHSTVPIGTSKALGTIASPVRGLHPNLAQGLRTFIKPVAGELKPVAAVAREFEKKGIPTVGWSCTDSVEAMKLWETTQYGVSILLEKEIHAFCEKHGLDFNAVYSWANHTYNIGYQTLGRGEFVRPVLKHMPGPIGGHCVVPNAHLLDTESARRIILHSSKEKKVPKEFL